MHNVSNTMTLFYLIPILLLLMSGLGINFTLSILVQYYCMLKRMCINWSYNESLCTVILTSFAMRDLKCGATTYDAFKLRVSRISVHRSVPISAIPVRREADDI